YRNSAVANRHALRSDYYSNTKKTANPLNEWWTTAKRRDERWARRFTFRCARRRCERFSAPKSRDSRSIEEMPAAQVFLCTMRGPQRAHARISAAQMHGPAMR